MTRSEDCGGGQAAHRYLPVRLASIGDRHCIVLAAIATIG